VATSLRVTVTHMACEAADAMASKSKTMNFMDLKRTRKSPANSCELAGL
jgi:hypothetical protein